MHHTSNATAPATRMVGTTVQTPAHPDPLSTAALRAASRLTRDTRLFLGIAFAAHAAVIVNLVAVLQ